MTKFYLDNRFRVKQFYLDIRDRIKKYQLKNHDKINIGQKVYSNNSYKTDINFRLIKNTGYCIFQAFKGRVKSISTKEPLGIDIDSFSKWIEYQSTPEMNWLNIEIDHVKPICMFDVSKDEELKEAFSWRKTQPLLKKIHTRKGRNFFRFSTTIH